MKKFNQTYLYKMMPDYEKEITSLILSEERLDKTNKTFDDIKYEIKRKNIDATLVRLVDSERIVLVIPKKPLPSSFRVITAKDIREDKKVKVFVDCSGVITKTETGYKFINNSQAVNVFISYLIAARTAFICEAKPTLITMNSQLTQSGTKAFSAMVNYILNYIGKININVEARNKSLYLAAIYYQVNLLGKDPESKSVRDTALKISGVSERQANIIDLDVQQDSYDDISKFVALLKDTMKIKGLNIDTFVEKWMFLYGTSTVFALELFPYFAQALSDAYVGAYINRQKTIEKVAGGNMVEFTKTLIRIGADS